MRCEPYTATIRPSLCAANRQLWAKHGDGGVFLPAKCRNCAKNATPEPKITAAPRASKPSHIREVTKMVEKQEALPLYIRILDAIAQKPMGLPRLAQALGEVEYAVSLELSALRKEGRAMKQGTRWIAA